MLKNTMSKEFGWRVEWMYAHVDDRQSRRGQINCIFVQINFRDAFTLSRILFSLMQFVVCAAPGQMTCCCVVRQQKHIQTKHKATNVETFCALYHLIILSRTKTSASYLYSVGTVLQVWTKRPLCGRYNYTFHSYLSVLLLVVPSC